MTEALLLSDVEMSRKEMCHLIVSRVQAKTGPNTPFGRILDRTKPPIIVALNELRKAEPSEAQLQKRATRPQGTLEVQRQERVSKYQITIEGQLQTRTAKRKGTIGALVADLEYLEHKSRVIPD